MDNQSMFLQNIREALGRPREMVRQKSQYPQLFKKVVTGEILKEIGERSTQQQQELVTQLEENSTAINLQLHIVDSMGKAADAIVELVRTKEPEFTHTKHILLHDHPDLADLRLWKRFTREAVTVHTSFADDKQVREKTAASFIGITAPLLGVADSATIVELTGPGSPRSTSLVPSIHIAFLRREHLVANLQEAYALLVEQELPDSFVFISGPSKTADIEAHMVHGAHGPREMHLVLLAEPVAEKQHQEESETVEETGQ